MLIVRLGQPQSRFTSAATNAISRGVKLSKTFCKEFSQLHYWSKCTIELLMGRVNHHINKVEMQVSSEQCQKLFPTANIFTRYFHGKYATCVWPFLGYLNVRPIFLLVLTKVRNTLALPIPIAVFNVLHLLWNFLLGGMPWAPQSYCHLWYFFLEAPWQEWLVALFLMNLLTKKLFQPCL